MKFHRFLLILSAGLTIASSHGRDPMTAARRLAVESGMPAIVEIVSARTPHAQTYDRFLQEDPSIQEVLRDRYASWERSRIGLNNQGLIRDRFVASEGARVGLTSENLLGEASSARGPHGQALGHVRFTVEDYPEIAEALRITSLPTLLVVTREADAPVARLEGLPVNAAALRSFLVAAAPQAEFDMPRLTAAPAAAAPAVQNVTVIPWAAVAPTPILAENSPRTEERPAVRTHAEPTPLSSADAGVTEGRFSPRGERETVYTRRFPRNVLWTIELDAEPGDEDLDLKVEGPDGEVIETSEGGESAERIILAAAAGVDYTLRVYAFRGVRQNVAYRLRERTTPLESDRIVPGSPMAVIGEDEEKEIEMTAGIGRWIRFNASSPGRYRVGIRGAILPSQLLSINAVAADGSILGRGDAEGFSFETVRGGGIHLNLFTPRNLTAAITVTRDRSVNLAAIRESLRPGRDASARVGGAAGLETLYRIAPDGAGVWIFELQGDPEDADIDLEILDGNGELIERSEGPAGRERIAIKIEAGEERIARVYVYRAETAVPFRLTMTQGTEEDLTPSGPGPGPTPEPAPVPPADAPLLRINDQRIDAVGKNEARWYRIEPTEDGLLAFFIEGQGEVGDIDLALHLADGERLAISQSESATEAILQRVERGKPVFMRVYAYGDSEGGRFRVWSLPAGR